MPDKWPLANGNWSNAANWNGGTKPVAGDDVYADSRTLNVDESFDVATLRTTQRSGGTIGGTFNFNTAGVTGTVTNPTNSIVQGSNTTPLTISASSGTITILLSSSLNSQSSTAVVSYTGLCNLSITTPTVNGNQSFSGSSNVYTINKSSSGTLTVNGNVVGGNSTGSAINNTAILSSSGSTIINGNVSPASSSSGNNLPNYAINQTGGTLTINGSVNGGNQSTLGSVIFTGTALTVNGNITGGTVTVAIATSAPSVSVTGNILGNAANALSVSGATNTIIGNVTAGTAAAIVSASANQIQVTGTVTASATSQAITMTNANGQVYLNGNMVNNNGKMAIFAPIVWLDKNNTTSAAFFTSGGVARTLYSADTVPNTPAVNNVRSGTIYGAGNSLIGTLVMPVAANSRNGVVYDNGTVGTALFTTSLFLTELSSSTVPVAVRMQNLCTPQILGELMEAFKK